MGHLLSLPSLVIPALLWAGCACGPSVYRPAAAVAPAVEEPLDHVHDADLEEAGHLRAWMELLHLGWVDEVKAAREDLAACLHTAGCAARCRARHRAACVDEHRGRLRANDQHYEDMRAVLLGE